MELPPVWPDCHGPPQHLFSLHAFHLISHQFLSALPLQFSSVQELSRVRLFAIPWAVARQASLSTANSQSLRKLMSIEIVMPSNHLILCHPILPPSIFSNESSGCFQMSQFPALGGQSIGVSASASVFQ